jgi:glyoxalase family protein
VKKTVNFDDPYTYHLYYGDSIGSPGTILTFFPWEKLPRGRSGAGMVTAVAFSIPTDSVGYWQKRINLYGGITKEAKRFGDRVVQFEDPHGLPLELIETSAAHFTSAFNGSSIPPDHRIVGLHSATVRHRSYEETAFLLTDLMGLVLHDQERNRYRFKMSADGMRGNFLDVALDAQAEYGRQGGGTVHHIAFRTGTDEEQKSWRKWLVAKGFAVTPVRDRKYFKSIYFHEPGGVLFEIATDPPGFTVDEPLGRLGHDLKLPDQYEPMRAEIERRLPNLDLREKNIRLTAGGYL